MKKRFCRILLITVVFFIASSVLFSGCSEEKNDNIVQNNNKVVAGITSPFPSPEIKGEHYDENMQLFGEFLKNVYAYECVYHYYKTAQKDTAFYDAVKLKTRLLYAINADYYLTEDEKNEIAANADSYLQMQYYTINSDGEYDANTVSKELFGITFEQYKQMRLCESFVDKCAVEMQTDMISQSSTTDDSAAKAFYESNKDAYEFVLLRYISYYLDQGGSGSNNQDKVNTAWNLCNRLNSIEDMMNIIGSEGETQSEGNANGQITVYLNDTDNIFYEFIHEKGKVVNEKTVLYDNKSVYVVMCEGYFTWDNSDDIKNTVKTDYAAKATEEKMLENILEFEEPEDWYTMSGLDEITAAKRIDNYESIVSKLKIADEADTVFLTVQDEAVKTSCKFYAYEKSNGTWSQTFKTNGYVGRSGIEDPVNRVEGNGTTPSGVYSFGMLFGIFDNPGGLKKDYKKLDDDDYWNGDRYSDTYNQYVKASEMPSSWSPYSSEHLIDYKFAYNYTAMINFNVNPTVKGKGSAIFLHCTSPGSIASAGCIAIPENKMKRAMRLIDDNAYIVILEKAEDLLLYC